MLRARSLFLPDNKNEEKNVSPYSSSISCVFASEVIKTFLNIDYLILEGFSGCTNLILHDQTLALWIFFSRYLLEANDGETQEWMSWSQTPEAAQRTAPSSGKWQQGSHSSFQCKWIVLELAGIFIQRTQLCAAELICLLLGFSFHLIDVCLNLNDQNFLLLPQIIIRNIKSLKEVVALNLCKISPAK